MMTSSPLIAGVDVHRKTNTYCLMTQDGQEVVPHFTLGNNRPETQALIEKVRQAMETGGFTELRLAAEATGWYWFHLFETLQNDPGLQAWPHELFLINPRLTANFKKSYVDLDKSDPIDAYVIADRLRWGRDIKTPYRYDEKLLALRFLTRYRYHVVHQLASEKAYCTAILYLKASEYSNDDKQAFSNLFGAASRTVLQEFASMEEVAAMPFDELVEWLDVHGKRHFSDPAENAKRLQRIARDSYPLPEPLQPAVNLVLSLSLKNISNLEAWRQLLPSRWRIFPTRSQPSQVLDWFWPLASWLRLAVWNVLTATKPRSPSSPGSSGASLVRLNFNPKKPASLAPATPTCATTSAKPPSLSRGVTVNMALTSSANSKKFANISISAQPS